MKATISVFKQEYREAQLPIVNTITNDDQSTLINDVMQFVNNSLSAMDKGLVTVQITKKGDTNND